MPLTPKQTRFVAEYLIDLNASDAARRAGYSPKTAEEQGYQLLRNTSVSAAIAAGKATQIEQADLSAIRVLEELRRIAFADPRRLFDAAGNLKPLKDWTAEDAACLASFEVVKKNAQAGDGIIDTIHKVKVWDKTRALEMLAKHFALLLDRSEVKVSQDVREIPTADLAARLASLAERLGGQGATPT